VVRTDGGDSDSFDVKVGLHQGSILSPLLFVIVMEMVTRELRDGLPWELLYADDLVLMAESIEELKDRILKWKRGMEAKGLTVNVGKTNVIIGGEGAVEVVGTSKWPCGVCSKGVGRNSLQGTICLERVYKRCSDVSGRLKADNVGFACRKCQTGAQGTDKKSKFRHRRWCCTGEKVGNSAT